MKRLTTALLAALDALIVVAIGVGIALVPLTVLWATQFELAVNWLVFWRAAVDVWLVGNGVDLLVQLDPALVAALGLPGAETAFPITIALLGFALLALLLGLRTGRQAADTAHPRLGVSAAILSYAILTALLVWSAGTDAVRPSAAQGLLLPPLVYAAGVLLGADRGQLGRLLGSLPGRVAGLFRGGMRGARGAGSTSASASRSAATSAGRRPAAAPVLLPAPVRAGVAAALRGGTAAAAGILCVAGITVFVLILTNYATIIGLYETVQAGILGGIALTIAQLALIPNLVIWAASWFIGPGVAVGVGSSVSPVGTVLGTVPGLPILGVLPQGSLTFGFVGLLVPVLIGFLAAVILRQRTAATDAPAATITERLLTGLGIGIVAGVLLGLLAWWSGGAVGPGRLVEVGPNPLLVGALAAAEVGVAACLGLLTPAPRRGATGTANQSAKTGATDGARAGEQSGAGRLLGKLRSSLPRR